MASPLPSIRRALPLALALAAVLPASASAGQSPCQQQFAASPAWSDGDLALRQSETGPGTCANGIRVSSRGLNGRIWGVDWNNTVWYSDDDLQGWHLAATIPGYTAVEQVMQLSDGILLASARDSAGLRHILRSTDSTGTSWAPTPALDFPSDAWVMASQSWVETGGAIYVGEYGSAHFVSRSLWKSTDDGRSFAVVHTFTGVRHIHNVQADPYVSGRIWVTIGDSRVESSISYSDDGGQTFTVVSANLYPQSRAIGLMFTADSVYWASDSPEVPAQLFRYERKSRIVTPILTGLNGSFRLTVANGPVLASFSAVETPPGPTTYIGDQSIHVVEGDTRNAWNTALTPWTHDINNATNGVPTGITTPDSAGRFWISYLGLQGSPDSVRNFELQTVDPGTAPPGLIQAPQVSGTAVDGQRLVSTNAGALFGGTAPVFYSYQWLRCSPGAPSCTAILGATSPQYTLQSVDVGSSVELQATGTTLGGVSVATSAPTAIVTGIPPSFTAAPTISGSAVDGQVLTGNVANLTRGTTPLSYLFGWWRCKPTGGCDSVAGASQSNYRLTSADVGHTMILQMTAENVAGSATQTSAQTAQVAGVAPYLTGQLTMTGPVQVGSVLTGNVTGIWGGTTPRSYAFQWAVCPAGGGSCTDVPGATSSNIVPVAADAGLVMRLTMTASNVAGTASTRAWSSPVNP